jgi:hypothetical protein
MEKFCRMMTMVFNLVFVAATVAAALPLWFLLVGEIVADWIAQREILPEWVADELSAKAREMDYYIANKPAEICVAWWTIVASAFIGVIIGRMCL